MKFTKKAVSPLIATILLIVVAVVLVTIVLTWAVNFTKDKTDTATDIVDPDCMEAFGGLKIDSCTVDTDTNKIDFELKNISGSYTFTDLTFTIIGDEVETGTCTSTACTALSGVTYTGLSPGQTMIESTDINADGATKLEVMSTTCPLVSATKTCD